MKEIYYTTYEVAEMLKISYETALELMKNPNSGGVKVGRQYRISKTKLEDFLYKKEPKKQKFRTRPIYVIEDRRGR
jgi:excisionase family DNA binding protein